MKASFPVQRLPKVLSTNMKQHHVHGIKHTKLLDCLFGEYVVCIIKVRMRLFASHELKMCVSNDAISAKLCNGGVQL